LLSDWPGVGVVQKAAGEQSNQDLGHDRSGYDNENVR
jgi:hypothetical protein